MANGPYQSPAHIFLSCVAYHLGTGAICREISIHSEKPKTKNLLSSFHTWHTHLVHISLFSSPDSSSKSLSRPTLSIPLKITHILSGIPLTSVGSPSFLKYSDLDLVILHTRNPCITLF